MDDNSELNKSENEQDGKGKLKIFFGYASDVGKTYAMLDYAQVAKKNGLDVVVGFIEEHTRPETLALLNGLETLPTVKVHYKETYLTEFDLDAALLRAPDIIVLDELAHTNISGMRHTKRYNDVEELLDAGINVYTTVNVGDIESLNDVISSITKESISERVPDRFFDKAFQVELIDIEPEELISRQSHNKNKASIKDNLIALREITLRRTADRVNKEVSINKEGNLNNRHFSHEHILVCLSPSPSNAKVIRTAARMADNFHASFTAIFVETANTKQKNDYNKMLLNENIKIAEELGATIVTTYGKDVSYQIVEFAKISGISKIIIGRTKHKKRLFEYRFSLLDKLINLAPDLEIYVIPDKDGPHKKQRKKFMEHVNLSMNDIFKTMVIMFICTSIGFLFDLLGIAEGNIIVVFILGILIISNKTSGKFYGVMASVIEVLIFNLLFIEPKFNIHVISSDYYITFLIMLVSGLITSTLTSKVKDEATLSTANAYRTTILLHTNRILQKSNNLKDIISELQLQIYKLIKKPIIFYTLKGSDILEVYSCKDDNGGILDEAYTNEEEKNVVLWVIKNKKNAGMTTDTLPSAKGYYIPLIGQNDVLSVVGIVLDKEEQLENSEKSLLTAMLNQISVAIEKYNLNEAQKIASMQAENERFRANLLRAISHDLRTPLTGISGSASSILSNNFDEETKKKLILDIYDDSLWLINLVENILSVSRLEGDKIKLNTEPQLVEEMIHEALHHINRKAKERTVNIHLEDELLMIEVDVQLIIQVIINIVDNAIKYTDAESEISITAQAKDQYAIIKISDNGKGISDQNKNYVFDMFFTAQGNKGDSRRGLGLGLALCKSIVNAHGGEIVVYDNKPHGTVFEFTLPLAEVTNNEKFNISC